MNYKAAAEAGDEAALCYYGVCMLFGDGLRRNERVAVDLLKLPQVLGRQMHLWNSAIATLIGGLLIATDKNHFVCIAKLQIKTVFWDLRKPVYDSFVVKA